MNLLIFRNSFLLSTETNLSFYCNVNEEKQKQNKLVNFIYALFISGTKIKRKPV